MYCTRISIVMSLKIAQPYELYVCSCTMSLWTLLTNAPFAKLHVHWHKTEVQMSCSGRLCTNNRNQAHFKKHFSVPCLPKVRNHCFLPFLHFSVFMLCSCAMKESTALWISYGLHMVLERSGFLVAEDLSWGRQEELEQGTSRRQQGEMSCGWVGSWQSWSHGWKACFKERIFHKSCCASVKIEDSCPCRLLAYFECFPQMQLRYK